MNYYIYYRVAVPAEELVAHVRDMQNALHATSGVRGRLLRQYADPNTWMEIYEEVANCKAFEADLQEIVARRGLETLLQPGASRHMEKFEPL
ncbi:MAG TPA: DUF4936 family protein [Burkholderiales bacterium]|nr:DUF4936 family protein [Burkholderiales bacterium]